jgi:thiamine transport system permease protein
MLQWGVVMLCVLGFALPLLSILVDGIGPGILDVTSRPSFWKALGTSLALGSGSAALTLLLALGVGMGRAATRNHLFRIGIGAPAYAYLAVPAVVLSLGAFLLVRNAGILPEVAAPMVVLCANALLSLPFALATLAPPLDAIAEGRGRLIRSLGLTGWEQFRAVEWPLIGREAGVVLALAFCFSLGDLGVIALFGTEDFATLPLLMYRALGAYRTNDAATIAALMLLITIAAFVLLPRLVARLTDARG